MDGTEVPSFDQTYSQQMHDVEHANAVMGNATNEYAEYSLEQSEYAAQWEEFADDDGNKYYTMQRQEKAHTTLRIDTLKKANVM